MKISALTTCVGDQYAAYLKNSYPIWKDGCDEVVVVTDWKTFQANRFDCFEKAFVTEIFTAHKASFNKGAALSQGFAVLNPDDWVLNFDSDILPPDDWRKIVEGGLRPGKLFGCSHRYGEDGSFIPDADFPNIWGFFHLWHISDYHSWKRPVFDPTCGHAGNYDHTFMMQWEPEARVDLWPALKLIHQGEPRQRWFGDDSQNERKMTNLFTLGLWDAWATRAGHITPPYEPLEIELNGAHGTEWVLKELRRYNDWDPFRYQVTVKP